MGLLTRINAYLRHETTTGIQLREMDAFRGWACLGVVMAHCVDLFGGLRHAAKTLHPAVVTVLWPFNVGWIGVDMFFFISGFLLHLKFAKADLEGRPRPELKGFYKRRFLRIAPAFYASIILIVGLSALSVIRSPNFANKGVTDVLVHLSFLHNLFPEYVRSINGIYWTLAVEFQFYLILPFFAPLFHGRRWKYALVGVLAAVLLFKLSAYHVTADYYNPSDESFRTMLYGMLGWRIEQFAVGMCFCELWLRLDKGLLKNPLAGRPILADFIAAAGIVTLLGIVISTLSGVFQHVLIMVLFVNPLVIVSLTGVIFLATLYGKHIKRLVANPVIELLGIISYSTYLWHLVILVELTRNFKHLKESMNLFAIGGLALAALAATFIFSLLSYVLFERPFLKRSPLPGRFFGGGSA